MKKRLVLKNDQKYLNIMDVDCNFCDIYNENRHILAYGPKTNDFFPYKKCPNLNCKNSAMATDSDNGYRSESAESIDHNEYDSDTNWDNWDLEPNIKVRKSKGKDLYKHFRKKISISKVHQPICKKVKKKPLMIKDSDISKLLSELQIKIHK